MTRFEVEEIKKAIQKVGIEKGDTLFIHSSLRKFGVPNGHSIRALPKLVFDAVVSCIGDEGTIAVPTFTFDFCKGEPFDIDNTPSKGMGAFSEYVRTHPESKRSSHPIQSIAVYGKHKDFILENDTQTAYCKGSVFDKMTKLNTKVLLFGATFETISFIHTIDEICQPPYRYYKKFKGEYIENDKVSQREYQMQVRDLEVDPQINKFHLEHKLNAQRKLKQSTLGAGKIQCFLATEFISAGVECMESNPYFFVENNRIFEMYLK